MGFKRAWLTTQYGPSYPKAEAEVKALTNQRYLRRIARKAVIHDLRAIAADSIKSQSFLVRLAQNDESIDVRIAALKRIVGKEHRVPIALSIIRDVSIYDTYRIEAIKTVITDYEQAQDDLRAILSHTSEDHAAIFAASLLDDENAAQSVFLRVALESGNSSDSMDAIQHITDEQALFEIIRKSKDGSHAIAAAEQIHHADARQAAYREIAIGKRFRLDERYKAVKLVEDNDLKRVVCEELVSMAEPLVWQQSGTYAWKDSSILSIVESCKRFLDHGSF